MEGSRPRLMYMENTRPSIAGLIFVWITAVNEAKYNDPITPSNAVNMNGPDKSILGDQSARCRESGSQEDVCQVDQRDFVDLVLFDTQGYSPQIGLRLPRWLQSDSFGKHRLKSD